MKFLTEIRGDLKDRHYYWLAQLCKNDYFGETPEGIVREAVAGKVQLYGFKDDTGIVVTTILQHKSGRELLIYGLAGAGIFFHSKEVYRELQQIAKTRGCTLIGGLVQNFRLSDMYKRLGQKVVAERFSGSVDAEV